MGEKTKIAWTDHSFNPWIGCTPVSSGCLHCYAERENKRFQWVENFRKDRKKTSPANWLQVHDWAYKAKKERVKRRIFCASLADVFDPDVPVEWREELWELVDDTLEEGDGYLEWLILTKRPLNIAVMMAPNWLRYPPEGLRLGVTVEDDHQTWRITRLLETWKGGNFISVEPMLSQVNLLPWMWNHNSHMKLTTIDWVICGGESGTDARVMETAWARNLLNQCQVTSTPFFFKQWGRHIPAGQKCVDDTNVPLLDEKVWQEYP